MGKKQDPQIEWGFHAVIPRIVRTGYEKLTPVQKWLYVCLKDLCGEHGTCYRALRVLAAETGISTGMLSESIRGLHDAGLIHAEKKRRNNNPTAKEVWHITIVDIWQVNAKEHPTKRSQNEHYKEDNVHTVNNNVQQVNNIGSERSQNEQKRSHSETEEVSLTSITSEAVSESSSLSSPIVDDAHSPIDFIEKKQKRDTDPRMQAIPKGQANVSPTHSVLPDRRRDHADREHSESAGTAEHARLEAQQTTTVPPVLAVGQAANGAHAAPTFSPPSLNGVQRGAGAKAVHKKVTQAKPPFTLDAQQQAFWDLWCNVWFNAEIKPILTETAYGHISKLAPYITDAAQLDSLIDYTRKDVAESIGMKRKMVQLGNMVHCYAGWKQAQKPSANGTFVIDQERNQRNIEAMKARNAQRRLEAHG